MSAIPRLQTLVLAFASLLPITWLTVGAVSQPQSTPPILQVRKWQVDYTLTASERVSVKFQEEKAEMFHQPSWSISGTAIVDMGLNEDGGFRTVGPKATANSWSGHTNSSGTFRGDYGVLPSPMKLGYAGGGAVSASDEAYNRILFQISTAEKTYEISLVLHLDGYLFSDVSQIVAQIDELEAKAPAKDAQYTKVFMDMLRAIATGGGPAKASRPFKASFNPVAEAMPLPNLGDGRVPTLSGSKKMQLNFPETMPGYANAVFSWTIKPYDDADDVDVTVKSFKVDQPHCVCGENKLVELTAQASKPGGTWEQFEVRSAGKLPNLMKNQGGTTPYLSMTGYDKSVGKVAITAVYTWKGHQTRSRPFEVNFCHVEKPEFVENASLFDGQYHVFDQSDAGEVSVEVWTHVWLNGQDVKENSEGWEIDPDGLGFETELSRGEVRAAFKASGLPERNSDFGKHQITYTYDNGTCQCKSEAREAQIFYARDARNNPEGKLPNWAYYWRKTRAGLDGVDFEVVSRIPASNVAIAAPVLSCLGPILSQPNDNVIARYDPVKDVIYLSDALPTLNCANRPSGAIEDKGVDCFAVTLRHEHQHQVELTAWWGPKFSRYSCLEDIDGDMVPNSVEKATPGCNSLLAWSCPTRPTYLRGTLFDVDLNAYQVGWRWVPHTADKEDWAYPGHQCGGR